MKILALVLILLMIILLDLKVQLLLCINPVTPYLINILKVKLLLTQPLQKESEVK